jgi:hypothetical protein
MTIFTPLLRSFALATCGCLCLAGCSRIGFDLKNSLGSVSQIDRCEDFMLRALDADIDVADSQVNADLKDATVQIRATRDMATANGTASREVVAECRYNNGVLTGFRWLTGPFPGQGGG